MKMSLKVWVSITLAALLSGVSFGDSTVPTQAYVFPSDNDVKPLQIYVILQQSDTVQFLTCSRPGGLVIPHSTDELSTLISKHCTPDTASPSRNGEIQKVRIFHQKKSDRYVKLETTLIWNARGEQAGPSDVGAYSTSVTFDNHAKGTLNFLYVFQDNVDGQNPRVSTYRSTKFKAYQAEIQYPVIREMPIEQ